MLPPFACYSLMLSALVRRSSPLKIVTGSFVTTFYHVGSLSAREAVQNIPAVEGTGLLFRNLHHSFLCIWHLGCCNNRSRRVCLVQLRRTTTDVFLGSNAPPHPIIYLHTDCSWKSNAWRISNRQEGRRRRRGRKRRRFSCEVEISNNKPARNLQNYNLPPRACVCVIRLKNWYNARKNSPKSFYFREYFPQTNVSRVLTFTI